MFWHRNRRWWVALALAVFMVQFLTAVDPMGGTIAAVQAAEPANPPAAVNPEPAVREVPTPGPTVVDGGEIKKDTVWGPQGSPYIVRNQLKIYREGSLTLLPGTVVKMDGNYARFVVWGQLLSLGTPDKRVVITSYKDDSVSGDTNGDGSATTPARGDWYSVFVYSYDFARPWQLRPPSIIDYTDVRYGGYGSGMECQAYGAIEATSTAHLVVANSRISHAMKAGMQIDEAADHVGVYNSMFSESGCGMHARGGSVVGNTFEESIATRAFFSIYPERLRLYWNTIKGTTVIAGEEGMTRAQADAKYNTLSGGLTQYGSDTQQLQDWAYNWWGHDANQPLPECATYDEARAASPAWRLDTSQRCNNSSPYTYKVVGHVRAVLPALSGSPGGVSPTINSAAAPQYGPVDTASGALTYQASDLTVRDAGKNLTAARGYRSDAQGKGDVGAGWDSSYSESLAKDQDVATMSTANGQSLSFATDPAAGYVPTPGMDADFNSGSGGTEISTPGQDAYQFNPDGGLTGMLLGDAGHKVTIDRAGGELSRVTGVSGRSLSYSRSGGKLQSVTDSQGRSVSFEYLDGRLVSATGVDGKTETYSYDGSGRLVKVTTPGGRTKLAAGYGDDGRVAWVEQAGTGRATFAYDSTARRTTITLSDESKIDQVYDTVGRLVTDQVRGGSGRHVVYDAEGRVVAQVTGVPSVPMEGFGPAANVTFFNKKGDPADQIDPIGRYVRTTFNSNHKPLKSTYTDGTTVVRTYDDAGRLDTVTDQRGKVWLYDFNNRGQVVKRTDPLGRIAETTYGDNGDRTSVTDETGATTRFGYDAHGWVTSVTDPIGRTRSVEYTSWGEPRKITSPRGGIRSVTFDDDRNRVRETDPEGATTRREYDVAGRLVASVDATGGRTTVVYDPMGRPYSVTDPRGSTYSRRYTPEGWPSRVVDPSGAETLTTYDPSGRPVRQTDALGQVTQTVYDRSGKVVRVQTPDRASRSFALDAMGRVIESTTPRGAKWKQAYNDAGQPTLTTDPLGKTVVVTYDAVGRVTSRTDQSGVQATIDYDDATHTTTTRDPVGVVEIITTDKAGQVIEITDPRGGVTTRAYDDDGNLRQETDPTGATTSLGYDLAGRPTSAKDPLGRTTTGSYDMLGRLTKRVWPDTSTENFSYDVVGNLTRRVDRTGAAWTYAYDAANRVTAETDPLDAVTTHAYDALGRRIKSTDPTGVVTATGYDPAGRPAVTSDTMGASWVTTYDLDGNVTATADPDGAKITFMYDLLNRLTAVADGGSGTKFTYDAVGNVVTYTPPNRKVTTFEYDVRGRQTVSIDPLGNRTTRSYDKNGNQVKLTRPSGNTSTWTYDAADRVKSAADAIGNTSRYNYDAAGELTRVTLPRGGAYTYTYDTAGQLASETNPINATTGFTYDAAGRLDTVTKPSGRTISHSYDAAGRRIRSVAGTETRSFGYDAAGRLTSANNPSRDLTYAYGNRGLLTTSTDPSGTTGYTHTAGHRLASRTSAGGTATSFTYDTLGRVATVRGGINLNYTYDWYSQRISAKNAVSPTSARAGEYRSHDELLRPTNIRARYSYISTTAEYTADGQTAKLTQAADGNAAGNTTSYGYDEAGRLTSAALSRNEEWVSTTNYTWDADGNRTSVDATGKAKITATYNAAGELTELSDGTTYKFDADGNRTKVTRPDGGTATYRYNAFGELASVTDSATTVDYERDALGRVSVRNDGENTEGVSYDGTSTTPVQQRTADGQTTDLMHDPNGELLATTTNGDGALRAWPTIHGDLGMLADPSTGAIRYSAVYDAFGNPSTAGTQPTTLGFQTMPTDPITGLVDMGARSYDATTGAFTSADTVIGDLTKPITLNRYTYANAAPLDYFDPDGHWALWDDFTEFVGDAVDWVGDRISDGAEAVSNAVDWVSDKVSASSRAVKQAASEVVSWAGETAKTTWNATRAAANVVQHQAARIATDVQQTALNIVHSPQQALSIVASVAAGAVTFVGCEALTAGAGSLGCLTAGFTVGGAVSGALDCPQGEAILSCVGTGAAAGLASGLAFTAAGRFGGIAASGISASAGAATGQYLTTGRIDGSQTAAAGILGAAFGSPRVSGAMSKIGTTIRTGPAELGVALRTRHQQTLAYGADRGAIRLGDGGNVSPAQSVRYGPHNPGLLDDAIASTFRSSSYTMSKLSEATTLYRVYGGQAGKLGSYWTRTKPAGPLQSQLDSALNPAWGNSASSVATIRVPAGTTIYEGAAASQPIAGGGSLPGGGSQVYIPRVDASWLVP